RRDGARPTRPHLFDAFGHLPDIGTGGGVGYVWEFNFREFDVRRDPTRRTPSTCSAPVASTSTGFPASALTPATSPPSSVVPASSPIAVSAARSPLDGSPFTAVLGNGTPLPDTLEEFLGLVNLLFGETVDLKYMMFGCEGLSGGLESVASTLGVPRQAGKSHQAGSDSLVTYQVYLKMKRRFFNDRDATVARHRGIIYGLHAC
ncbi:CAF1 family ribonuclease, partial [Musa troglodytarum]